MEVVMRLVPAVVLAVMCVGCAEGGSSSTSSSSGATSSSSGSVVTSSSAHAGSSSSTSTSGGTQTFMLGSDGYGEPFAAKDDGAEVRVVFGPQGGYHIWLSVGFPSTPADPHPDVTYHVTDASQTIADGQSIFSPSQNGSMWTDVGLTMFIGFDVNVVGWMQHPVDVSVTLKDGSGNIIGTQMRHWKATCGGCSGVGGGIPDGGPLDGEGGDGGIRNGGIPTCQQFCAHVMDGCAAADAEPPFSTTDACMTACAGWPEASFGPDEGGNTRICREHYAQQAESDEGSCFRLQNLWDTFCVDR